MRSAGTTRNQQQPRHLLELEAGESRNEIQGYRILELEYVPLTSLLCLEGTVADLVLFSCSVMLMIDTGGQD
jgi:hypothetical protein